MARRYGIDLGTTYSAISYYDEFKRDVETIDVDPFSGTSTLRSVVYYEPVTADDGSFEKHNVVVGETAYRKRHTDESRVIELVKRSMGTSWNKEVDGVSLTPELVSAEILRILAERATEAVGEDVREVVVTVPAYFSDPEKFATSEAIKEAGLVELQLLEEPAAAALAYSLEDPELVSDRLLLVYDLGGGTFDTTLIRTRSVPREDGTNGLDVETLAVQGAPLLGGVDWNNRLQEYAAEESVSQYDSDPFVQPHTRLTFEEKCEEAKRMLSTVDSSEILVTMMGQSVPISREKFDEITAAELGETEGLFRLVVDEAEQRLRDELEADEAMLTRYEEDLRQRMQAEPEEWTDILALAEEEHSLTRDEIDSSPRTLLLAMPRIMIDVLLCGGSIKMRAVSEMIKRVMGRPPMSHGNPELLVARGAAYAAHLHGSADGDGGLTPVVETPGGQVGLTRPMQSIVHSTIGVETVGTDGETMEFSPLLEKGTPWDEQRKLGLAVAFDNMEEIPVTIREWTGGEESSDIEQTRNLGTTTIRVPAGRPKGQRVDVTLWVDTSGIIRGEAIDLATGNKEAIEIDRKKQ